MSLCNYVGLQYEPVTYATLRTVFVKVLETRIVSLVSALTLNPSPKKGEGLQSGTPLLPFWEKGLGDVELALPEGWASHLKSVRTIATVTYWITVWITMQLSS